MPPRAPSARTTVVAYGDSIQAEIWVDALRDAGIRAAHYIAGHAAAIGGPSSGPFARHAIVVEASRIGDARNVIAEMGGAGDLAPIDSGLSVPSGNMLWIGAIVALVGLILVFLPRVFERL